MQDFLTLVQSLDIQSDHIIGTLKKWVEINSGSQNLKGLEQMLITLKSSFASLGGQMEEITLKPFTLVDSQGATYKQQTGKALRIRKRADAPIQILLAGHMDTVYPADSAFQRLKVIDGNTLNGPGCADMKGGLLILLKSLEIFEQSASRDRVGWEVLITPDEELGSPSSEHLYIESAKYVDAALIFEPSFPDGSLVSSRKGSVNFTILAHGKSAHAGRDFSSGINAVSALMKCLLKIENLSDHTKELTINIGKVEGGVAVNIVPDLAIGHCNARMTNVEDYSSLKNDIEKIIQEENTKGNAKIAIHWGTARPPRLFDEGHRILFEECKKCAHELGYGLSWKSSGGVCDGNILSNAGIPTIDTLGAIGGNIHTHEEFIKIDSVINRAKICTLLLLKISTGEINIKRGSCE